MGKEMLFDSDKKLSNDSSIFIEWPRNGVFPKIYSNAEPEKRNNGNSKTAVAIDSKFRTVLIFVVISAVIYKISLLSMPQTDTGRLLDISDYVHSRIENVWEFVTESKSSNSFMPILCGIGIALFSWILVYLDSNVPGIHPPSPFSPRSKLRFRRQKTSAMHLGYITALASGVVVTALMTCNF